MSTINPYDIYELNKHRLNHMQEVTYGALKKPSVRMETLKEDMVSLGTQSGNYGPFTEQARILTLRGAKKILSEIKSICKDEGLDLEAVLEFSPTLAALIK